MREELLRKARTGNITLLLFFLSFMALGEGTKEIMPAAADVYYLEFNRSGGQSIPFGVYTPNTYVYQTGTSSVDYRINIRICNVGEIINFGFKSNNSNTWYRIRRPSDGSIVYGPTKVPSSASAGYIATYAQAVAGPQSIVGASGYNNNSYTALETGDYYIEFNQGNGTASTIYQNNDFTLQYFDITVSTSANVAILGRLWSKAWQYTDPSGNPYYGSWYVYSDDGIVTKLDGNKFAPWGFSISCNSTGVSNTGNPAVDEKSVNGPSVYPQYKIFYNNPDSTCFPTGSFGNIIGIPTITGCGSSRCINMQVDKPGNIIVTLDLNGIAGYQPGTSDRQISAKVVAGLNCIPWDGLDGLGNSIASGTVIPVQVDYLNGITHFPLYDGELNVNGYIVTLVRPTGPRPKLFWDDSNYIPSHYPASTALDGITNYTGCINAAGCHRWNGPRGDNTCPPCSETCNTWWYANIRTINVNYTNSTVFVDANGSTPGTGFAANNFSTCGTLTPITLNGVLKAPAGVSAHWTSNGTGTFTPNDSTLGAKYTPTTADTLKKTVQINFKSKGGVCPTVADSMIITLVSPPSVFAGATQSICKNNNSGIASLSSATKNAGATSVAWTGGAGTYNTNNTTLNITYKPTAAELTANSVTLTLTGKGDPLCANSVSTIQINYTSPPTANAGGPITVCSNNRTTALTGTLSAGAISPQWSSASGCVTCFSAPTAATTNYTASAADSTKGSVVLTFSDSSAGCLRVSNTMTLSITPAPTAYAGLDQALCKNNTTATLAGVVTNASSSSWTSSSGCVTCFSNPASLTSTYKPSTADTSSATGVTLTLTAIQAGCNNVTSSMKLTFTPKPSTKASGAPFCLNVDTIRLKGTILGPPGATAYWSGNGGSFSPSTTDLNPLYTISALEKMIKTTGVYFIANYGNCKPDTTRLNFAATTLPIVNAGPSTTVCANNLLVKNITGTITGASLNPQWTSPTGGTFSAIVKSGNNYTTNYTFTKADSIKGSVILTFSANIPDINCTIPVSDTMTITMTNAPTVNAGADQTGICYTPGTATLNGFSSTGTGIWSGGGGSFTATGATSLNATYNSTAAERAGGVTLTLTSTNNGLCNAVTSKMRLTFAPQITVSAGSPATICANNALDTLNGTSPQTGTAIWSGGTGTFSPNANTLNAVYTPSAAEISSGSVTLTLTPTGSSCTVPTSTVTITITPPPTITITAADICADNPVANASVALPGSLGVIWSGGLGTYTANNTTPTITYKATNAEILADSVVLIATTTNNGLCKAVTAKKKINIAPAPTINAGADQVLCGNTASANLNGTVTGATGGTWTTSGTGTFGNANALVTTYTPSAADKNPSGLVTLTLTSTGNGKCNAVTDQMTITFTVVPTVNAGPDITVCTNTLPAQLAGTGSPAAWSGGAGSYTPNNGSMTATYNPTLGEQGAGNVTLTLTTNASGACPQISDQVVITILPSPKANAGADITACGSQSNIPISGSVNAQATGGFWTTPSSGTIGDPTSLNTTYNPSNADKIAGKATLILTTTGNGACGPNSDTMIIFISPAVTVFAGPDQTLCQDGSNIALPGTITGASGGTWTVVTGGGTITNPTSLTTAFYTPNATDVTFTARLTTTGNPAGCATLTDDVTITLTPKPTVTVGTNQTVCADVASVALTGTVTNASGQNWTNDIGAGTFSSSSATANTSYVPAASDAGKTITFTLTSSGSGACLTPAAASMKLTVTAKPTISAGGPKTVCNNNSTIALTGVATVATGGTWTTSGDGTFSLISGNGLSASYTPGTNDKSLGSVNLKLTSTGNGTCNAVSDMMVLTITPSPTITKNPDRTVCANNSAVPLAATITVATGGTWKTLGSGTFSGVSSNGLNATYTPSAGDAPAVTLVFTTTGNGLCNPVTDTVHVTITPTPVVNAGANQIICADSAYVKLHALYTNASAGIWTTSGTGSFFNSNAATDTAVYSPTLADRSSGSVTLTFTTTVQGACKPVSSNLVVTITKAPVVTAAAPGIMCSNGTSINITGSLSGGGTGVKWTTSGNGTFGSNTTPNTTYIPSAVDKAAGTVVLTITSTGNGTCHAAFAQATLKITQLPVVNLGAGLTVCSDVYSTGVLLHPTSVTNDSLINWSSSSNGAFSPNGNTVNATYYPTTSDTVSKSATLTMIATGNYPCPTVSNNLIITFNPVPIVNAGSDMSICNGSTGSLNGKVLHASGGTWTTSGTGSFAPNQNTLNASYIPSPADTASGSVTLTLTSTGTGTCNAVTDQMVITFQPKPTANAGSDVTVCFDAGFYTLNGGVTNASGGTWTSSSNGTFSAPNNLSTIYGLTSKDSLNGSVVLTLTTTGTGVCAPVSDNIIITVKPVPSANAGGPSINVCITQPSITLHGKVVNATGAFWSSQGDGTFDDPTLLDPTYTFGPTDIANKTVLLNMITEGNGVCQFYSDTIRINFTAFTSISAGPNRTICVTDFPITLQGSGSSGTWSGGTGTYSNMNSLTSTYTPSAAEISSGSVTLTVNGPVGFCPPPPSSVTFTFTPGPSVTVSPLATICTNVNTINLTSTPSSPGNWTSTGTGSFASTTNSSTTFTPSAGDKAAGQIKFTYTIPAAGFCNAVKDTATILINPTPVVNAGPDQTRCANALTTVTMNGTYTIASGIQWRTVNGTGTLTSPTLTNASYTPSAGDVPLTPIEMVLETTGASNCSVQRDTMLIIITNSPTATIGSDTTMCADKTAQLTAATTISSGGTWTTSGTGTFSPNNSSATVVYTPSAADTASKLVTVNYMTTGNGICSAINASKKINMTPKPMVGAGPDDKVCSGQDSVALGSTYEVNAPSVLWTTTGTGTFSPSNTSLNAYYKPSAQDKANGGAILRLASTGVMVCDSVFDYMSLVIIPSPVASVNAGFDQTICKDQNDAQLAGFILIATAAVWDCHGAPCSGSFLPNDQNLSAQYIPSSTDKSNGSVILRLTTTAGNGICTPVFDEMKLTIIDIPTVNAGTPQTVCADTAAIQLTGLITEPVINPKGYSWVSSSGGIFAPNAFVANPVYIPNATDKTLGSVSLTLTSTNNGTCQPYSATVVETITTQPTISAGIDRTTCANVASIVLTGTMSVATGATWTTAGTGVISAPSANGLNITYTHSLLDDTAGSVVFNLTTTGGLGSCKAVSDQMTLTLNPAPKVNAGVDHLVCADNPSVGLSGTISIATGGLWTSLGSGTFGSNTNLNTTYTPSATDTASHAVKLVLTSTGNGLCLPETDTLKLTIAPKPIVSAGTAVVCEVVKGTALNGYVANAGGGLWSAVPGGGSFALNAATLNATYYPSAADVTNGSVTLTLTSTANGTCNQVTSTTSAAITRIPVANAGPDQFICEGITTELNAALDPLAVRYQWKESNGTILNANSPSINVVANTADTIFILTVYDYKNCASPVDTVLVRTFTMPKLHLTGTVCMTNSNFINSTATPGLPHVPGIFQWYKNTGIITGQNTASINPTAQGSYFLTFSYGGCTDNSDTLTMNPSPIVAGIDKTNCVNNVTNLATSGVSGGAGFTYNWATSAGNAGTIQGSTSGTSINVLYTKVFDTTAYAVTVTNSYPCSTSDSVYLITVAQPLMALMNDTLCANQTDLLDATTTNFGVGGIPPIESYFPTYTWTKDGVNLNHNAKTLLVTQAGKYIVNITIGDCNNNKDSAQVIYNQSAVVKLPQSSTFCAETDSFAVLNATAKPVPGYTFSYLWKPNGDTTAITDATTGAYYYITVTSKIGTSSCPMKDSILVKNLCPPRVFVPNVITPDKDGNNKTFRIFGGHYTNFSIIIFNRWGEIIFASENLEDMQNVGWDGTYKGEPMPQGVYTWIMKYDGEADEFKGPYKKEGEVLILR